MLAGRTWDENISAVRPPLTTISSMASRLWLVNSTRGMKPADLQALMHRWYGSEPSLISTKRSSANCRRLICFSDASGCPAGSTATSSSIHLGMRRSISSREDT